MTYRVYSIRNKTNSSEIYNYDEIPSVLRNQIVHIIDETFGEDKPYETFVSSIFKSLEKLILKEHGLQSFSSMIRNSKGRVLNYLRMLTDVNKILDVVELCFRMISLGLKSNPSSSRNHNATIKPDDAISELNDRFLENSVGYQFVDDVIIRISNQQLHNEIIVPTVQLLNNPIFENANEEYIKAHQHFKNGLNKECLTECLKALESTLKIIFNQKSWGYNATDTLVPLITVAYTNNLIPEYIQTHLGSIRAVLTSGVSSIRNKVGAHGQGATAITADDETTRFTLNLTGSYIIYLIELSKL